MPAARLSVSRTQVRGGGHPESTTVPVGCQAVGLVKYHLCCIELAPFGLSDHFECSLLTAMYKAALISALQASLNNNNNFLNF